jgi:hypothetical protein
MTENPFAGGLSALARIKAMGPATHADPKTASVGLAQAPAITVSAASNAPTRFEDLYNRQTHKWNPLYVQPTEYRLSLHRDEGCRRFVGYEATRGPQQLCKERPDGWCPAVTCASRAGTDRDHQVNRQHPKQDGVTSRPCTSSPFCGHLDRVLGFSTICRTAWLSDRPEAHP